MDEKELEIEVLNDKLDELDEYNASLRKELKETKTKLKHKKVGVAVTTIAAAAMAISVLGTKVTPIMAGREVMLQEFYDATNDYGVSNGSNGFIVIHEGREIAFDDAVMEMISACKHAGLDDTTITAGLIYFFNGDIAKHYCGDNYVPLGERVVNYEIRYLNDKRNNMNR